MKEVFFTFLALSIPIVIVGGLVYLFLRGLYMVYADWQLGRELEQLRQEVAERRHSPQLSRDVMNVAPISEALKAEGRKTESQGIYTMPLDGESDP